MALVEVVSVEVDWAVAASAEALAKATLEVALWALATMLRTP